MNSKRYQELINMSDNDVNNLTPQEKSSIQKEFTEKHQLSHWESHFLPSLSIKFYSNYAKDSRELIDELIHNYKGTDVAQFEKDFLNHCLKHDITIEELNVYRNQFQEFLADNRTYTMGWEQAHLLGTDFKLPSIPNFPFKIRYYAD